MSGHVASRALLLFPLILLCFTAHRLLPSAEAIWLSLPASGTKCVSEEIQNNVVVLGDYIVINAHGDGDVDHPTSRLSTISSRLTSPYGNTLHSKENETHGHFAFTTSEAGNYVACFWLNDYQEGKQVDLNLEWRTGIAAKDWESVAKKEKIDGVELELRKLEGAVEAIRENLIYLKDREAEMREVSERTNGRVAWFSIMSLGVCIVVSVLQLWHLKSFFRKKKLI